VLVRLQLTGVLLMRLPWGLSLLLQLLVWSLLHAADNLSLYLIAIGFGPCSS